MKRYIIVDDDPTNNLICRLVINKFRPGASVISYTSPKEALAFLKAEKKPQPSILFLDINMPIMTGWEFLDEFVSFNKEIKNQYTIYILSSSIEDFSDKEEQYPFLSGFFSKPLKIEYLKGIEDII